MERKYLAASHPIGRRLSLEWLEGKHLLGEGGLIGTGLFGAAWLGWEAELEAAGVSAEVFEYAWGKVETAALEDPSLDWLDEVLPYWISPPVEAGAVEEPTVSFDDRLVQQMHALDLDSLAAGLEPEYVADRFKALLAQAVDLAIATGGSLAGVQPEGNAVREGGSETPKTTTETDSDMPTVVQPVENAEQDPGNETLTTETDSEILVMSCPPMCPQPNIPPTANDDSYTVKHDRTLVMGPSGVLGNDFDYDGPQPITASLVQGPQNGTLNPSLAADGSFTYIPNFQFVGVDTFTYRAFDGADYSATATVSIDVTNLAPVASDDTYGIGHGMDLVVEAPGVKANDFDYDPDPFEAILVSGPSHADFFAFNYNGNNGSFKYRSVVTFWGEDTFTYKLTDGISESNVATVTITVRENAPPIAYPDEYTVTYCATGLVTEAPGVLGNDIDYDMDPLTAHLVSNASAGTVSLNADGSFTYTPTGPYVQDDSFTYKAKDLTEFSNTTTVELEIIRPTVDIDTDSDNDGLVERNFGEEVVEMIAPGNVLRYNNDDDNGNFAEDRLDAPFLDPAGNLMLDDELEEVYVSIDGMAVDLTGYKLDLVIAGSNVKLWKGKTKQPLQMSYTIGIDELPPVIYVEGVNHGSDVVHWILTNSAGCEVHRDSVMFTVIELDLIAHRPQTEGPGYGNPFPKTVIPEGQEAEIGIRRNGDDDDGGGVADKLETGVGGENDLIEIELVAIPAAPAGIEYRLSRSNANLNVWISPSKYGNPVLKIEDSKQPISPGTYWVEWVDGAPFGTASLSFDAVANGALAGVGDWATFVPFTSVVIAFGGNTNIPLDPSDGVYVMSQKLYDEGYDVHAYSEEDVDAAAQLPLNEVRSAVDERGVTHVAIFGYSQGGGATYVLSEQLAANPPAGTYGIAFTAYIDAIEHDWSTAEQRFPIGSTYHVNYYQRIDLLLTGNAVGPPAIDVNVSNTIWGANLDHDSFNNSIDSNVTVQNRILNGFAGPVDQNNPAHSGLKNRTPK
ncbi:MAG: cadherin-like domain-containing protein [Pirellulales bacterium]